MSNVIAVVVLLASLSLAPAPVAANGYSGYIDSLDSALQERIQITLLERGFDPGPIDGVFGRRSYAALMDFRDANDIIEGEVQIEGYTVDLNYLLTPPLVEALFEFDLPQDQGGPELSDAEQLALLAALGLAPSADYWERSGYQFPD